MLFVISALIIGVPAAAITLQDANAASNHDSSCRQHPSEISKCTQNDTPMILPFP
jgi:hypothetical protein